MEMLSKALRTDVMADLDLKAMAQVLRSRGRGRDTVLAHITPREARRLKAEGGSGTTNPDTGLPEFEELDFASFAEAPAQSFEPAPDVTPYAGGYGGFAQEVVPGGEGPSFYAPGVELLSAPEGGGGSQMPITPAEFRQPAPEYPDLTPGEIETARQEAGPQRGYFDRLGTNIQKQLQDPATLARLGLGLGVGGLGAYQQMRSAAAAKQARTEQAKLGEPFRQQGMDLMEQAKRGELSPASAQAYQAAQARMAQQQSRTGGVGVMQGAATLERLRSQLLQNQYSLGVNLANIGNQYIRGAITSGLQGDQALRTATNQFYGMLGNVLGGPTGQAVGAAARA